MTRKLIEPTPPPPPAESFDVSEYTAVRTVMSGLIELPFTTRGLVNLFPNTDRELLRRVLYDLGVL